MQIRIENNYTLILTKHWEFGLEGRQVDRMWADLYRVIPMYVNFEFLPFFVEHPL